MDFYVYVIKRVADGRAVYVGQTTNPKQRWKQHRVDALNPKRGVALHAAMKKYGRETFVFEVLPVVFASADECDAAEVHLISALGTRATSGGYNILPGGSVGSRLGKKLSPETRARMSAAHIGKKHSAEVRAKIGAAHLGRPKTPEHRRNQSLACKGRVVSPETRAKISAAGLGRVNSPETRAKLSKVLRASPNIPRRPVVDQNGVVYESAAAAARVLGLDSSCIRNVAYGKMRATSGYTFRFVVNDDA